MEYSKTLNLPKTKFPMKANLLQREPDIQKRWEELDLYSKTLEKDSPKGTFVLHDGPPYSNGNVHIGNALQNKIPKDFILKYKRMAGFKAPYIPGWDNHGMPIEVQVAKLFRQEKKTPTKMELRKRCREYATKYVNLQREQYKRIGICGNWKDPYLTMSKGYEASIVKMFGELALKGYVYRGLKPIHWCSHCETALALAEIEYENYTSHSIYVSFPLRKDPKSLFKVSEKPGATIIWTTTPWTIPANLAVTVHPDLVYVLVETKDHCYLVAEALLESTMKAAGISDYKVLAKHAGNELEGLVFKHPIFDRDSVLTQANYVSSEDGTGVVHTAPGHGPEDFETGVRYGLDILCPVDPSGHYTKEAGQFEGLSLEEGDAAVLKAMEENGSLLYHGTIDHSYPHCWRCHKPVIFRTTIQWFMGLDRHDHRKHCLEEIKKVNWLAPDGESRMGNMLSTAPDWCLSRQRSWGVGIPVFYCKDCHEELITPESIDAVYQTVLKEGSDAWFSHTAEEILPAGTHCGKCGGTNFEKESDILDVWFDSGSSWNAVVETRPELQFPADIYMEGYDQYRGWFNSSLNVAMGVRGQAPYKSVITHGMGLDAEGRAMHKSRGNVIQLADMVKKYGADVVRLTASSFDFMQDVKISDESMKRSSDVYRRIRNTFRYFLGNIADFDPAKDSVPYEKMMEVDRWVMHRIQELVEEVTDAYDHYHFHPIYHAVHNFCAVDLSSFYLDMLKDRLYTSGKDSLERRSAQTVLYTLADTLVRIITPILSHTAEEIWGYLPGEREDSPQLASFPVAHPEYKDATLAEKWDRILKVRDEVNRGLEASRQAETISQPLEARVDIDAGEAIYPVLMSLGDQLDKVLIVSKVVLNQVGEGDTVSVKISKAEGQKCERCWLTLEDIGANPKYPTLCKHCAEVVEEQGFVPEAE